MQFAVCLIQVLACMAELELDAFVAPTSNAPAPKLGAPRPLGRHKRPDIWSFLGSQGIPNMTVPAGFTTCVYDRVRDESVDPASIDDDVTVEGYGFGHLKKEGYRMEGPTPAELAVGLDIMSRPFGEPVMLKIASAFEAATHHRRSPSQFGPL